MAHKHNWKKASNAKHTFTCIHCGMKRTKKRVKAKGRWGFRYEVTFQPVGGKKIVISKAHNYITPPCRPKKKSA